MSIKISSVNTLSKRVEELIGNKTAQSFGIYFFTTFISKAFYFISFLVFSHYLTKDDLGYLSICNNAITFFSVFINWGVIYNLNTNFFRLSADSFNDNFKSLLILPVLNATILFFLLLLGYNFLNQNFGFVPVFLWFIPLCLIFTFLFDVGINMLRNKMMQAQFAYISILKLVVEIAIAFLLILSFKQGWLGRILGVLFSLVIPSFILLYFFYCQGYFKGKIKLAYWKKELMGLFPILVMQISVFMLNGSDKFFLNYFDSPAQTGLFSVATNLSTIIIVVSSSISMAIIPRLYKSLSENKDTSEITRKFYQYLFVHLVFFAIICCLIWVSYTFLLEKTFYTTMKYAYITLIGYFFWTLANYYLAILLYLRLFRVILMISMPIIIISFLFNYFLIKEMSLLGASLSIVVCNMLTFIILLFIYILIRNRGIIKTNLEISAQ